jgi:uncharacterized membrane protein YjfL (UPF0719 family)
MWLTPDTMRFLLLACILGMALLAAFYLRRRQMTTPQYILWGLLALLIPLLGPFLVILAHPGTSRKQHLQPIERQRNPTSAGFLSRSKRLLEHTVQHFLLRGHDK